MRDPRNVVRLGSASLRVTLLVAMLMFTAGASQADRGGDRGSRRGGRSHESGGVRSKSGEGERQFRDGGTRGGRRRSNRDGDIRTWVGGGRANERRTPRAYGEGGRTHGRWGRAYRDDDRRTVVRRAPVARRGGTWYHGGASDYVRRYDPPVIYRYVRPRSYVGFSFGLGLPYYCPPSYRYHHGPAPVVVETELEIDVENEPPAGCYYHDPFCDRDFPYLDEYTDHIDNEGHAKTIQIIELESGDWVRTLEFVGGYWSVQD